MVFLIYYLLITHTCNLGPTSDFSVLFCNKCLLFFPVFCVSSKLWNLPASQGRKQRSFKVPLKAIIVQNLFSQMHQNYTKYTYETFTVDGITIAHQIERMIWIRIFCICIILVKNLWKSEHIFQKICVMHFDI
jgi:hypothetical protein